MTCRFSVLRSEKHAYSGLPVSELEVTIHGDVDLPDGQRTFVKLYIYREGQGDATEEMDFLRDYLSSKDFYRKMRSVLSPIGRKKPLQNP